MIGYKFHYSSHDTGWIIKDSVIKKGDRLRFDLSQDMNWDDFERTMREIHAILGDVAAFVPFANPRASNSGKPREKHEVKSTDGKSKHTYYDYYD